MELTHVEWLLRALISLAKRKLADANNARVEQGDWPAGQEWGGLGHTSQHTFMRAACAEAGIPYEEYRALIKTTMMEDSQDRLYVAWEEFEGH